MKLYQFKSIEKPINNQFKSINNHFRIKLKSSKNQIEFNQKSVQRDLLMQSNVFCIFVCLHLDMYVYMCANPPLLSAHQPKSEKNTKNQKQKKNERARTPGTLPEHPEHPEHQNSRGESSGTPSSSRKGSRDRNRRYLYYDFLMKFIRKIYKSH